MLDTINGMPVYRVASEGSPLGSYDSATDLIGELYGQDAEVIVIPVERLDREFFRLASGIAGSFMEKLQQYRLRLAIVGDIGAELERSAPLRDFVRETNRHGQHLFVADEAELVVKLKQR